MRKGGFRNQAKRQQVRNKEKFNFKKQQLKLREDMKQLKDYKRKI
mgnify:CR=1 FL=1